MKVQGVTSFCAGEALSQPSCLPRNSWKILLTAFIMSVSPSSDPSPLWRCCCSRNCAICTWGCWGSVSVSHGKSWSDYPASPGKGRDLSWGGSKLSISTGSCFTPGFPRVFHRKSGVSWTKWMRNTGGNEFVNLTAGDVCTLSIKGAGLHIFFGYLSFNSLL